MAISSMLLPLRIFYDHVVYVLFGHFGIFWHVLVCCTKKNLAFLAKRSTRVNFLRRLAISRELIKFVRRQKDAAVVDAHKEPTSCKIVVFSPPLNKPRREAYFECCRYQTGIGLMNKSRNLL
jgi:hypothetical protein